MTAYLHGPDELCRHYGFWSSPQVILDCSQANSGFYERCGLVVKGVQMAKYFDH